MAEPAQTEQIKRILRTELRAYAQVYKTVQFTLYGLPLLMVVALVGYLFLRWFERPLFEFHSMAVPASYILAGYLGYAWLAFQETTRRAAAVSAAKVLAELHGLKVIHWPGGKGISNETLEVVSEATNEGRPVNWSRNWSRWDCLADLT